MNIQEKTKLIRYIAIKIGNYKHISEQANVNYHWLQKFAIGTIQNPTVANVAKLEEFFKTIGALKN